ncbi:ABC transporter substrate-binding protein [Massilia sp. TS11]|uniref:substrate-binding periplasmic protein n=1 Tax=Massilia sp. TS11 TaxID=2908003 RepID=UPI001EDB8879|nr:transporter substrate-binding domain-containing protein [Massilia sp. TS11]MCG2585351.1 transporter substrate-binding domain-containing protein [Massilia sp. TS11]
MAAALCSLALGQAHAAAPACGEFGVGYYEHGALYYQTRNGWAGIDKDIIEELSRRTGCQFRGQLESTVRIQTGMEAGRLAMTVSSIPTPERNQYARSVVYMSSRHYAVLSKMVPPAARTMDGFLASDYKVGVVRNFHHSPTYEAWLANLRIKGRVYEAADMPALVRLLKAGRVQALVLLPTNWPLLKEAGLLEQVHLLDWAEPQERIRAGLLLSRKLVPEERAEQFQQAILAMRNDGTLEAIFRRHLGPELAHAMIGF